MDVATKAKIANGGQTKELTLYGKSMMDVLSKGGTVFCNAYTGLGDAIILGPLLRELCLLFPDRVFFPKNPILELYRQLSVEGLKQLRPFDGRFRRFRGAPTEGMVSFFEQYDVRAVVNFRRDMVQYPKDYSEAATALRAYGYHVTDICSLTDPASQKHKHVLDLAREYFAALGLCIPKPSSGWFRQAARALEATAPERANGVLVHLGSGQAHKRMPPTFWEKVVRVLSEEGLGPISLLSGYTHEEGEEGRVLSRSLTQSGVAHRYFGPAEVPQAVGILLEHEVVVSCDTYIVHLAGALGKPVTGVYTSSSSIMYGPYYYPSETVVSSYYQSCGWRNEMGNCDAWERGCQITPCKEHIREQDVAGSALRLLEKVRRD